MTASIGISLFPSDAQDEESLTTNADAAMYAAKEEGCNGFRFHTGEIKTQSIERLMLETSLRRALERNELLLHYQPKRDLSRDSISRGRGPAALASSRSRSVAAQSLHPARRGDRPDRADRQMGARDRLRSEHGLAAPRPAGDTDCRKPVAPAVYRS